MSDLKASPGPYEVMCGPHAELYIMGRDGVHLTPALYEDADAHLLAASWEMYKRLEIDAAHFRAQAHHEAVNGNKRLSGVLIECAEDIESLLAKARGETP